MASRTGVVGEGDDRTFRSFEGARLSAVCSTAMSAGREADTFDLGGPDVEEWPMPMSIAQLVTGLSELVGVRRPSVVV